MGCFYWLNNIISPFKNCYKLVQTDLSVCWYRTMPAYHGNISISIYILQCVLTPAPAKHSETRSELHNETHVPGRPAWGDFFHPTLEFVQESNLGAASRVKRQRGWSWFPSPAARRYRGRGSHLAALDSTTVSVSNFHWKLSLRGAWTGGVCPLQLSVSHTGFISCRLQVWQEYPKYVSGNQSSVFSFGAVFQLNSLGNHILPLTRNWFFKAAFAKGWSNKVFPACSVEFVLIRWSRNLLCGVTIKAHFTFGRLPPNDVPQLSKFGVWFPEVQHYTVSEWCSPLQLWRRLHKHTCITTKQLQQLIDTVMA